MMMDGIHDVTCTTSGVGVCVSLGLGVGGRP